jgi:Protein of unknown function (DUF1549)/Protein of unknown function (DUF1553)
MTDWTHQSLPPATARTTRCLVRLLAALCLIGWQGGVRSAEPASPAPLTLRAVSPPEGNGHPIDSWLGTTQSPVTGDAVFARRAYLDLTGLLPTPEQLQVFVCDPAPGKRESLVRELLGHDRLYADHWITFWQDLLRDGKLDVGSTDVFQPITLWLRKALEANTAYDEMARELVNPTGLEAAIQYKYDSLAGKAKEVRRDGATDAAGFVAGLQAGLEIPRGDQQWQVQATQNISQVFLGVQIKCATCHDSFIDEWTMDDAWGLASIYSEHPLEAVRCEIPTGTKPPVKFLFDEVGTIDPAAPVAERRARLAQLLTAKENGRFPRTIVNRLWARLMGRGLIEPVDEMHRAAFHPDLLEWLAADFVEHGYDLKHTIGLIVTSRAYQLQVVASQADTDPFRGPLAKRLTAEQFEDAIGQLTGRRSRAWAKNGDRLMEALGRPDRRTVTTQRLAPTSTLQSLELMNGAVLHEMIYGERPSSSDATAKQLEQDKLGKVDQVDIAPIDAPDFSRFADMSPDEQVQHLFRWTLARSPTPEESAIALALFESRQAEGDPLPLADLVWSVAMLPEFQWVR